MRLILGYILGLGAASLLMGCDWSHKPKPSILVIAVDSLGFDDVSCESDSESSGFTQLCQNSVRFTHAYTTSVLTAPALASVLTGLYPIDHGVRHNGSDFLRESFVTAPEIAITRDYRTALVSGGPPIFRRTGLAQGVENFDDNLSMNPAQPYRTARDAFHIFLRWLDDEVSSNAFFSVIYLADAQFSEISTFDYQGEKRARSFESQIREIDESLDEFIQQLKNRNRWNNTHVVLVGLNGRSRREHGNDLITTSLLSANSQVALLIKPSQKDRDVGIRWTMDKNVTLADLGSTLFELLTAVPPKNQNPYLNIVSLASALSGPHSDWDPNRWILIESGWSLWKGFADVRYALRKSSYLTLLDEKVAIYNSLTDRFEASALDSKDPFYRALYADLQKESQALKLPQWTEPPAVLIDHIRVAEYIFRRNMSYVDTRSKLLDALRTYPRDRQLMGWLARAALKNSDWATLEEIGDQAGEKLWQLIAQFQAAKKSKIVLRGCGQLFRNPNANLRNLRCEDDLVMKLARWYQEKDKDEKESAQEAFLRAYVNEVLSEKLAELNFLNHLVWDVNIQKPSGPLTVDLLLTSPYYRKEMAIAKERRSKAFPDLK